MVDPRDGQAVVDLLNGRDAHPDDIGTSDAPTSPYPPGIYYGDLRQRADGSTDMSEMLYGEHGALSSTRPRPRPAWTAPSADNMRLD